MKCNYDIWPILKNNMAHGHSVAKVMLVTVFGISLGLGALSARAQTIVCDSVEVKFPQSKSALYPNLDDNKANLDRMVETMKERADSSDLYHLRNIKVIGSASPEGSVEINKTLSEKRAQNIFNYIGQTMPINSQLTEFEFIGRDWKGLYQLILDDPETPYQSDIIQLLTPAIQKANMTASESDRLLKSLKGSHNGIPYQYLYRHHFPQLRNSRLSVEYEFINTQPIVVDSLPISQITVIPDTLIAFEQPIFGETITLTAEHKPFYMGLKTNMLSDALLLPNIGAEFYLGKNWSVVGNWTYGWWDRDKSHWYWRGYGGDLAVRKWFGSAAESKPLTGHHIGVYAGVLTFDFEFGGVGHMGGRPGHSLWDRCLITAGIEYGYSLPIARRLNLDFTIGIGYIGGKIVKYHPTGAKYVWDSTRNFKAVLPTKAEISLVWLIGCDNYNK